MISYLSIAHMQAREILSCAGDFAVAKALPCGDDAVAEISTNIYNGFDYLLPLYHKWIDFEEEKPDHLDVNKDFHDLSTANGSSPTSSFFVKHL